jgi:adenylate kinase family enzyme
MRRVAVVGTSGSGKTTLAAALAARLGARHIELDALHWEPNWTEAVPAVFRARVAAAVAGETWVADGNYSKVRDLVLGRADTLVWLDYPLALVLWQLTQRTLRRLRSHEELWQGNRERLRMHLSRDSLFLWALQTHGRNRRRYLALIADPELAHLRRVRLRSPAEADRWLESLTAGVASPLARDGRLC